jgi:signal peptidase II
LAGAFGNIIDSVFYGSFFDDSHNHLATYFLTNLMEKFSRQSGRHALFSLSSTGIGPQWLPVIGGGHFKFFNAIFNIADMAISTGVGILIVFNKKAFHFPSGLGHQNL